MTKRIPVGPFPHYYAIVDDEDFESLVKHNWLVSAGANTVYAYRTLIVGETRTTLFMHMELTGYDQTDHHNGIGLDNRRVNLRTANHSTNSMNEKKRTTYAGRSTSSKYKGVSWNKVKSKWQARLFVRENGRRVTYSLGYYTDEVEAAKAYDAKARELFGHYARLNFPLEGEQGCL